MPRDVSLSDSKCWNLYIYIDNSDRTTPIRRAAFWDILASLGIMGVQLRSYLKPLDYYNILSYWRISAPIAPRGTSLLKLFETSWNFRWNFFRSGRVWNFNWEFLQRSGVQPSEELASLGVLLRAPLNTPETSLQYSTEWFQEGPQWGPQCAERCVPLPDSDAHFPSHACHTQYIGWVEYYWDIFIPIKKYFLYLTH